MKQDLQALKDLALSIRRDVLDMTYRAGANGGHLGGGFSAADILAVLYGSVMHLTPATVDAPDRDRFFLSKGHIALAHYAVLAETGFIPRSDLELFEVSGSAYPTHAVMAPEKGIEISSGSLGYGLSIGVGAALSAHMHGRDNRVYVLLGDGECNEGSVWEAAMSAAKFKLDHLVAIVDVNGQSLDGYTDDTMPLHDFVGAFQAFGWQTLAVDGHDIHALLNAFATAGTQNAPTAIIAHTVKCKGLPSLENQTGWHHARLSEEQYQALRSELEGQR